MPDTTKIYRETKEFLICKIQTIQCGELEEKPVLDQQLSEPEWRKRLLRQITLNQVLDYAHRIVNNIRAIRGQSPWSPGHFQFTEAQLQEYNECQKKDEEEKQLNKEVDTHLEVLEKRQKQELLDKITKLEKKNGFYKEEIERLKVQNKKAISEELANKMELCEKEIAGLKKQLEQLNKQQTTQMEVPPKDNKIKNFFQFGSKK